jgi:hypothetical protein
MPTDRKLGPGEVPLGEIVALLRVRVRCGRRVPFVRVLVHTVKESEGTCGAPALVSGGPPAAPAGGR